MKGFLGAAPGAVWTAIIIGLPLIAAWGTDNFGEEKWVAVVASLIMVVIVPILKVVFESEGVRGYAVRRRSAFRRWLV